MSAQPDGERVAEYQPNVDGAEGVDLSWSSQNGDCRHEAARRLSQSADIEEQSVYVMLYIANISKAVTP